MIKHVVLDDFSLWALLRLAHREGLVRPKGRAQIRQLEDSDPKLERQVLEQLVLTPKVLAFFDRGSLCEDILEGEFLDSDNLIQTQTPEVCDSFEALPKNLITGIMQASGQVIPEAEFVPRLTAAMAVEEERKRRIHEGKRFPGLSDHIFKALKQDKLTVEEWDFYHKHRQIMEKIYPIERAFHHAQEVMTAASEHSAYGMVPYFDETAGISIRNPRFEDSASVNARVLFRVVAQDIGTLLPPTTLTGTLKLAGSPEAEALRYKSAEWIDRLESGELNNIGSIRDEIRVAMRSLEKTKRAKTTGAFVTLAAVPVAVAEMLIGSPGIAGLAFGAIGTVAEVSVRRTEKRYRWALLGKR